MYVMNVEGANKKRILVDPLSSLDDWGPARRILYTDAEGHINTIKPDGSGKRLLSDEVGWAHSPSYSPDGSRIAFQHCRHSGCRFLVMKPDGSKRRLPGTTRPSDGPTWSPDGNRVLVPFFRIPEKRWDLKSYTTGGSSAWLTKMGGIREGAVWQAR